ncbi:MAG: hypothetical protein RI932_1862 [Pseudomonadota bacterium]|jgi:hypothetical protein
MVYKNSRLDEIAFQRQFEEALNLAMHHIGINYSEALELVFTPLREQGGLSVADYVRRGQLPQAKRALVDLIDSRKRSQGSNRVVMPPHNY